MDELTMRDRFAMAALNGMLSNIHSENNIALLAKSAYVVADAMMEARKAKL